MPSVEADPNAAGYEWSAFPTKGRTTKCTMRITKRHKKTRVLCFLGSRLCFSCTFPVVIGNYSTVASRSPELTGAPSVTPSLRTIPFLGDLISFCIFIASNTTIP